MNREQLLRFKEWFTEFAAGFYNEGDDFLNRNIRLKECHTHRVCREMRQLAQALEINGSDVPLAEAIALFHDVGRFPQFKRYRTYKDHISENHCLLALKVLADHDVLAEVSNDERAMIQTAVEFHGAKSLPPLDARTQLFAQMIRDADKIDILGLLAENYRILAEEPEHFQWELEFPDTPDCDPAIIDALCHHRLIDYHRIKTVNDAKLLQLGWVYDVNFDWSLKQIRDRGHLRTIIDLLPKPEPVKRVTDDIMEYVNRRIDNAS